ncbi:hypothetical protein RCH14_000109 [Massilia sp. MP_M2]|uniref:nuclear transport factor 2 family protein n=1 Tax=Massilia sp. MP_M2 TaxID=3071713 RepID=UPI00319D8C50
MISVLSRRCSYTLCKAGALACLSITVVHAATPEQSVSELVQRFATAQGTFDRATLEALTAENYSEISPLGEVDPRAKMLSFYVKHDDKPLPAISVDEITTRVLGNTAIVLARVSYAMTVGGQSRTASLRSSFVALQQDGAWKLVSAQYTPIRPPAAPAK